MSLFSRQRHLTDPQGIRDSAAETREGMAHFAGTGPEGRICRECTHWNLGHPRTMGNIMKPPRPVEGACLKFKQMIPRVAPKPFWGGARSCRWFELLVKPSRRS